MSELKFTIFGSVLISLMGLIVSCSNGRLTRKIAKELIRTSGKMPEPVFYTLKIGDLSEGSISELEKGSEVYKREKSFYSNKWTAMKEMYENLKKLGYVRILKWEQKEIPGYVDGTFKFRLNAAVVLTDKAKRKLSIKESGSNFRRRASGYNFLVGTPSRDQKKYRYVEIKVCEKRIEKILGITPPSNAVDGRIYSRVEYSWKYGGFVDVFDAIRVYEKFLGNDLERLREMRYLGDAYLVLYDDGWRVAENHATEFPLLSNK